MGGHVPELTCLEICAATGGQSLRLEQAGFAHAAAVEIDPDACATLRLNRPDWTVIEQDVHHFKGVDYRGVDLFAGGVPCPPFSIAGKQLGADDERDLFPQALRLVEECEPTAVMLENVRGLSTARFAHYREQVLGRLRGAPDHRRDDPGKAKPSSPRFMRPDPALGSERRIGQV
jgi:DNA (cytosine-5)-methyltransferase 1